MRIIPCAIVLLALLVSATAETPQCVAPPCASKQDVAAARQLFDRGLASDRQGRRSDAYQAFQRASELVPENPDYLIAREYARQQLVSEHLERGNAFLGAQLKGPAANEFAAALQLDPTSDFAAQRLRDAMGTQSAQLSPALKIVAASTAVQLAPGPERRSFDLKGDTRSILQQVASSYGITALFDESVTSRQVRMTVDNVDFDTAMSIAGRLTKTFAVPVSPKQVLIADDTTELRRQLQRVSMSTFFLTDARSPQELNEVVGLLRGVFDLRYVALAPSGDAVTVRAPTSTMQAVQRFLDGLRGGRPQVMLEVRVYEVSHTLLRNLGVSLPLRYTLFNVPTEARNLLNTPGTSDLINQLIASGAINQANITGIQALIAQLLSQQQSVFNQPFATFGKGITLMGLAVPSASVVASFDESNFRSLQHLTLRAGDGSPATLHIGSRYPILNASFAPIFNTPQIAQVLQNQSYQAAFPSFTYEDLGLTLKTTADVHGNHDVTLNLEMSVKQLTGQSVNAVPVLSNREFKGIIRVASGETAVMVGSVSDSDQQTLTGPPLLSLLPGIGRAVSTRNVNRVENELLITVTPTVVREPQVAGEEIVLPMQ